MKKIVMLSLLVLSSCSYLENAELITSPREKSEKDQDKSPHRGHTINDHYETITDKNRPSATIGVAIPLQ